MENQKDYLQNIEEEIFFCPASVGIRFANYLIDLVVYYGLNFIAGILLLPLNQSLVSNQTFSRTGFEFYFLGVAFFIYFLYYFLMEGVSKGKTVGKLITGTTAVDIDGLPITWKNALMRSLIRFVPLEPFSTFGGFPWHDRWAYTTVIKENK